MPMLLTILTLAAASMVSTAPAPPPAPPVSAVLGERASEFDSLDDCNAAISVRARPHSAMSMAQGSVYNRANGNITRCAMIDGEPMIIVTPRPDRAPARR